MVHLLPLLLAACGNSGGSSGGGSDGGNPSGNSVPPECERYLACLAKAAPSAFPTAMQSLGPGTPCWTTTPMAAQLCVQSCTSGIGSEQYYADKYSECGCRADNECTADPKKPRCDVGTGKCVECVATSDCSSGYCEPEGFCDDLCQLVGQCIADSFNQKGDGHECGSCANGLAYAQCAVSNCAVCFPVSMNWDTPACTNCLDTCESATDCHIDTACN
jgi:hypothetical protein